MKDQSPYEGLLDKFGGQLMIGQVTNVDIKNRTVRVRTIGNPARGTDDQDLQNVKVLHLQWNPDGSYAIAMPLVGTYYIIGFINSEPVAMGVYPLSQTFGGGQPTNQQSDDLAPGDFAFVTAQGSRIVIRSGGSVQVEATKNCRTWWLPTNETITTVCQNSEMHAAGGLDNWSMDPKTFDTTHETRAYDNGKTVTTMVRTQAGTTDDGSTFKIQVGAPNASLLISSPTFEASVKPDGTTTVNVGGGQVTFIIAPDGKLSVTTSGDVDITAGGNIVAKGSQIQLNGTGSGVTTANSHLGVIDLITGTPVQPSTTVFADI